MKKILILFIVFSILFVSTAYLKELNSKLVGKTIVIDVGHGGKDSGATYNGVSEKDINLKIAKKLEKELIKNGVKVLMVREGDYDLSSPFVNRRKKSDFDNRIKFINESNADMFISIHINYLGNSKYYGAQVFYTRGNEEIAANIQEMFGKNLGSPMKEKLLSNEIYMYKQLSVPGVLIECGFLSNAKERTLLQDEDYQKRIVNAILEGIINYY